MILIYNIYHRIYDMFAQIYAQTYYGFSNSAPSVDN